MTSMFSDEIRIETMSCQHDSMMQVRLPDYLVLVNKQHLIDTEYIKTVKLVEIKNVNGSFYKVEEKTAEAFHALQKELEKKDVKIGVDSAYRSIERQQEIMMEYITAYGDNYARKTVAEPGSSEHHTGLAIDIVPMVNGKWIVENKDMLKETKIFQIIHKTLPLYGFILRYPLKKEDITGFSYEPWHIRYIGNIHVAEEIYKNGITLEEYLEKQDCQ